jgi:predicted GNAT family acetyltransferase
MRHEVKFHIDIDEFTDLCYPFLIKHEAENNLLFGILNRLKQNLTHYGEKPVLISISDEDGLKLVSIRTPPYNQIISHTEDLDSILSLVNALSGKKMVIPGVLGFTKGVRKFVKLYSTRFNKTATLKMNQRIFRLDTVNPETFGSNTAEPAHIRDLDLILEWIRAFVLEATPEAPPQSVARVKKGMKGAIEQEFLYVLRVNEKIVSMAGKWSETPNGRRIGGVYTPPDNRNKGYGTEVVAKVSQSALDEGKQYCFLFTDLSNPYSNRMYQKIGYRPIIDVDDYKFG